MDTKLSGVTLEKITEAVSQGFTDGIIGCDDEKIYWKLTVELINQ